MLIVKEFHYTIIFLIICFTSITNATETYFDEQLKKIGWQQHKIYKAYRVHNVNHEAYERLVNNKKKSALTSITLSRPEDSENFVVIVEPTDIPRDYKTLFSGVEAIIKKYIGSNACQFILKNSDQLTQVLQYYYKRGDIPDIIIDHFLEFEEFGLRDFRVLNNASVSQNLPTHYPNAVTVPPISLHGIIIEALKSEPPSTINFLVKNFLNNGKSEEKLDEKLANLNVSAETIFNLLDYIKELKLEISALKK